MGGQQTCIPLKVNTSGVIPVIFAQSLMQTPVIIASFLGKGNGNGIGSKILKGLSQSNWCDPKEPVYSIGLIVYIVLIIAFAYFYTNITFNPLEIANNMKRSGGFIPGIRPGHSSRQTNQRLLKSDIKLHCIYWSYWTCVYRICSDILQWSIQRRRILWWNFNHHHCRSYY